MMLPVVLLVGLDAVQSDACRSVLADRARIIAVLDLDDATTMLSLHRPRLVVMRTDLLLSHRRILADLAAKIGARIASVGEQASAVNVEHLIEGFAAVTFAGDRAAAQHEEDRTVSGTRRRTAPGEYHFATPRTPAVSSKAKR